MKWAFLGLDFSPIRGPEGNIEYLLDLKKDGIGETQIRDGKIREIVETAHGSL